MHTAALPSTFPFAFDGSRFAGRDAFVHKRTDTRVQECKDRYTSREDLRRENHMLFIVSAVVVLIAVATIGRMRLPDGVSAAPLGWMSRQWLAEYRASHSS